MASAIGGKLPIVALCFFLLLIPITSAARSLVSNTRYSQVQEHLKRVNKPPVKSIQSPDGDIIDCVPAAHQLAFDNPLLKNHAFQSQMRPSGEPEGYEGNGESIVQMWHVTREKCPKGTVAIRRIKEEELLRASSVEEYGRKKHRSAPQLNTTHDLALPATPTVVHEYAIVGVQGSVYYGTQTTVSVWQPNVQSNVNEFSLSQLWITAGSYAQNDLNTIEVGWQVYPSMYGNSTTRLFTYWTRDAYGSTGCYNLGCSGFVQTSNNVAVGAAISSVSSYGGTQYAITILVFKDKGSGNWWLRIGSEYVGYWPSSLFTRLGNGATNVEWGGEIVNQKTGGQHTTTGMGSGHFAAEGGGKASLFKNIQTVDGANTLNNINANSGVLVDNPNCYSLQKGTSTADGTFFYYGGPGRNPSCP